MFVNEPRLSDFKQVLIKAGVQAEFSGGVLICNNVVAVRRVRTILSNILNQIVKATFMHCMQYTVEKIQFVVVILSAVASGCKSMEHKRTAHYCRTMSNQSFMLRSVFSVNRSYPCMPCRCTILLSRYLYFNE